MLTVAHLDVCPHRATLHVMNISHAADLWLGHLALEGHSDRTIGTYRRLLDKLADEHARHVDVDELTVAHLRGFLDRQSRRKDGSRKRPATIAQNVSIVNGLFDWLTREGVIARNPTRRNGDRIMSRPRQVRPEDNDNVTTVSGDGVRRLLAEANRGGWSERLAVNCLVYLGPRRRAVARLRVGDYDAVGRMLTFREKGGATIEKPVPHELARIIEAAIVAGVYKTSDDYLIPGGAQQRRVGERDDRIIWRLVRQTAERAGVTTHVHALRAAFAVHFLETHEGELVALQKLMGHKRIETTLVYLRRLDRRQQMETVRDLSWGIPTKGGTDDSPVDREGAIPDVPVGTERVMVQDAPERRTADSVDEALFVHRGQEGAAARRLARVENQLFAVKPLEANGVTEKEGFEPSMGANPDAQAPGTQRGLPAPLARRLEELRQESERARERG